MAKLENAKVINIQTGALVKNNLKWNPNKKQLSGRAQKIKSEYPKPETKIQIWFD